MCQPISDRSGQPREDRVTPPKTEIGPAARDTGKDRSASTHARSGHSDASSQFWLDCPCGRKVGVRSSQAGSRLTCDCGSEIRVPSLSKLRELSGIGAYESSTVDTIQGMVERGELPEGDVCTVSGEPTRDVLILWIVVPRAFENQEGVGGLLLWSLWAPLVSWGFALVLWQLFQNVFGRTVPVEDAMLEHHRARRVIAPLRVASRHHAKVRRASQRRLKRLLRSVPIYNKLLDENTIVIISVH